MTAITIAYAQVNSTVGDLEANMQKLIDYTEQAKQGHQADIIVFPELVISGYPPEDLLFRKHFVEDCHQTLMAYAPHTKDITSIVSLPYHHEGKLMNAAAIVQNGEVIQYYFKQLLPNYGVFDELRYFHPGNQSCFINIKNKKLGIIICEDLWQPGPVEKLKTLNVDMIVTINASPYGINKPQQRIELLKQRCSEIARPILYVNAIGGQDELVFDGGSTLLDQHGKVASQAPYFKETLSSFKLDKGIISNQGKKATPLTAIESIFNALVLAVRDYVTKNKFNGVLVGSSGGIDSAVTLAIAVAALGNEKVTAVMMPSQYTANISLTEAERLSANLNIQHQIIPIKQCFQSFIDTLAPSFAGLNADTTEENIQARCRGTILMALSNKTSKLVLTTGNRSEMAVGYATLYGDMAGGFAVLKNVYKQTVYELAKYINRHNEIIPEIIITRPPSAELADNQKDSDSLPDYPILDQILSLYLDKKLSFKDIINSGHDEATVKKVIHLVDLNEYKRRQAPPGPRIDKNAFGRDRRYPITNAYRPYSINKQTN